MNTFLVFFMSVITIIGMVLTYRLLVLIIDKRNGGRSTHAQRSVNPHGPPDQMAWQDLAERAEDLSRRLKNLEEILLEEEEEGEA